MLMKAKSTSEFTHYVGDCIAGLNKKVEDESIDVVVTSPPYNLGIGYRSYVDKLPEKEYLEWTLKWAKEVERVMKPDASLFLNLSGSPKAQLLPFKIIDLLVTKKDVFHLQNTIHWIKSIALPDEFGVERQRGHYKPINSSRYVNDCHEYVFHLTKNGNTSLDRLGAGIPYSDKSNISRWKHTGGSDLKCRGNNWFIPYKTITRRADDRPHPATFPTELAVQCIKLHGKNGTSVVLDPFMGIGHSALAAAECRCAAFIGFEIDSDYAKIAKMELKDEGVDSTLKVIK